MDGTLVDSEKHWDSSLSAFYESFGGAISPETRAALVGASAEQTMMTAYTELGLTRDPEAMAESIRRLHDHTADLFEEGLPWRDGAREMLEALAARRTPMALVTNTQRELTELALDSIGRQYFSVSVCGNEVPRGKPAPDPYLRAAELLGIEAAHCLAVEDSVTGAAAAEDAGCAVLVVPNEVPVPGGRRRRHVGSLAELQVEDLHRIHRELAREPHVRTV